jgi:predicted lysophospholipase L1 biosynthesis ABC-type transport system permease subunit
MTRRQVGATIGWQALAVGGSGLLIGLPLGIAAGRLAWAGFADQLGVDANTTVPGWLALGAVGTVMAVTTLVGAAGATVARGTPIVSVLRAEDRP